MPPRKYPTIEQFDYLKEEVDENKAILFDIKDNHLKHLGEKCTKMAESIEWLKRIGIAIVLSMIALLIAQVFG